MLDYTAEARDIIDVENLMVLRAFLEIAGSTPSSISVDHNHILTRLSGMNE